MVRRILDGDLDVTCPLCNAPAGLLCRSTGGHGPISGGVHRERRRDAETIHGGRLHQCDCPDVPDLSARVGPLPEDWQDRLAAELDEMDETTRRLNRLAGKVHRGV